MATSNVRKSNMGAVHGVCGVDSRIDARGRIAFSSSAAGGSGIFLATPAQLVPAAGPVALWLLVGALLAAGRWATRSR